RQIERSSNFLSRQPTRFHLALFERGQVANVNESQFQSQFGDDNLYGLIIDNLERGPQRFMSADNLVKTFFQRLNVERSTHTSYVEDVIERVLGLQLIQEPEPLLGKGQWNELASIGPPHGGSFDPGLPSGEQCDPLSQTGNRRRFKQCAQG